MFGNKKNNLPPRPSIPNVEQMLEDLEHAAVDDVAFKVTNKEETHSLDTSTSDDIYKEVKTFLNIKQQLKQSLQTLITEQKQLLCQYEEIQDLTEDIRRQAQEALKHDT